MKGYVVFLLFILFLLAPSMFASAAVLYQCGDLLDCELTIEELQIALARLGYYQPPITGKDNGATTKALKAFQKAAGLTVDGIVKAADWQKLAELTELKATQAAHKKLAPPDGEVCVVLDTFRCKLIVLNDGKPYAQFPVAIGKKDNPSPLGHWRITSKAVNWGTGFGTRWLGLNVPWGVYGIHGTNKPWSIGSMASHGCFRMFNKDVETIYPWFKHGTPVYVLGNPFSYLSGGIQKLQVGTKSAAVAYVQEKLILKGYLQGRADGLFGPATEQAVKKLQTQCDLETTGQVGYPEYKALGILFLD